MAKRNRSSARRPRPSAGRGAYALIVRGRDGRPRVESVSGPAAYRARLAGLADAARQPLSIDDIAQLLDSQR